jgi:hypothetical protein
MRPGAHDACRRLAQLRPARASYKLLAPPCVRKARVRGWPRTSFCGTQLTICARHSPCRLQHRRQGSAQAGRGMPSDYHSRLREAACPGWPAAPAGLCLCDAKAEHCLAGDTAFSNARRPHLCRDNMLRACLSRPAPHAAAHTRCRTCSTPSPKPPSKHARTRSRERGRPAQAAGDDPRARP